ALYALLLFSPAVFVLSPAWVQVFFVIRFVPRLDLHSFPTRRSSDLAAELLRHLYRQTESSELTPAEVHLALQTSGIDALMDQLRSEEHTSELQSREKLVCRLLLEKKNTN